MRQPITYITSALFILLLARTTAPAQSPSGHHHHGATPVATQPPVTVKATVDRQQILIGQPIQLMLEATVPGNAPLAWPGLDSLPHFEWVEKGKVDSVIHPDGRYYRQYLTITSFDSGSWAIPALPFLSGNTTVRSDSVRIEVGYTKIDPKQDYHDIKDIIDIPNPFARWIGWIVAAVTLGSLALVIWLIRKKKLLKVFRPSVPVPRLSPYEEAIQELEKVERQRLAENGSVKVLYTRLNDILRQFVLRKLDLASLSETNEELIGQLRQQPITPDQFAALAETLRVSDFVKFAKYQPGIADNEQNIRVIRSSVEALNKIGQAGDEPPQ